MDSKNVELKAKANEFLYYKLKELGLVSQMDLDIGVEFLDLERIAAGESDSNMHQSINSVVPSEQDNQSI